MTLADILATAAVALNLAAPAPIIHPSQAVTPNIIEAIVGGSESVAKPEDTIVSVNMVDANVVTVLSVLSSQSHVDLVLLAPSDKKLTLRVNNKRLIDVIRVVTSSADLGYLKIGTMFVLAPDANLKDKYPKEYALQHPESVTPPPPQRIEPVIRVVQLSYVSGAQIATVLTGIYGKTDALTITAGPVQASPVLSNGGSGLSIGGAAGGGGSAGSASSNSGSAGSAEGSGKLLVLRGDPSVVEEAAKLAKQLDIERAQVTIAVSIYDISDNALKNLGLDWSFSNVQVTESNPNRLKFGSFSRTPLSFTAAITALETKDLAKTLASPTVSLLDGEQASILSGDRISYPVVIGYSQANTPIFDKQEERVGIYLQVAASVSDDDHITLTLSPQVSTITGFLQVNGGSYPQISTREARTTLRFKNGETIIMGGLLKSEETSQIARVPLLGQLPILGELFTRRKKTKNSSQVIISIRPMVIRSHEPR